MSALLVVGAIVAAVALAPSGHESARPRERRVEATLQLSKLGKNAKVFFITQNHYPIGHAGLTPRTSCCDGPNQRCIADETQWKSEIWQDLDFQIDEPSRFQYEYESRDGKTYVVHAFGTYDCSSAPQMWTLRGSVLNNGNAVYEIEEP